jgi:hypothetical protein
MIMDKEESIDLLAATCAALSNELLLGSESILTLHDAQALQVTLDEFMMENMPWAITKDQLQEYKARIATVVCNDNYPLPD